MTEYENQLKFVSDILGHLQDFNEIISNSRLHNTNHTLETISEYVEALFSYSKFKVGGRVQINADWEPYFHAALDRSDRHGWRGGKHFLIEGAAATVKNIDYRSGRFVYNLHFDDESYMDIVTKKAVPIKDKALYCFQEKYLDEFKERHEAQWPYLCVKK